MGEDVAAAQHPAGSGRLVPAGLLARALGTPSSVLSYYESRLPGVRAVAHRGGRSYRRADAMLLCGVALEVAEGGALREVLERARSGARAELMEAGRAIVDECAPALAEGDGATRPVPRDAIVTIRGARRTAAPSAGPAPSVEDVLHDLMDCVHRLQRAR